MLYFFLQSGYFFGPSKKLQLPLPNIKESINIKEIQPEIIRQLSFKLKSALQSFELSQNVVIQNGAMMQEQVFIQYTPSPNYLLDESFLDLNFAFDLIDTPIRQPNFDLYQEPQQPPFFQPLYIHSDHNQNSNFFNNYNNDSTQSDQNSNETQQIQNKEKRSTAKSTKTKNICFNICQKTVKVMKTRIYNKKLEEISAKFGQTSQKVIQKVLKIKKDLTGPKALQMFVQKNEGASKVFKVFMKWFLQQKYLRHAINEGTMDDLKGYLEFKNEVILNILED